MGNGGLLAYVEFLSSLLSFRNTAIIQPKNLTGKKKERVVFGKFPVPFIDGGGKPGTAWTPHLAFEVGHKMIHNCGIHEAVVRLPGEVNFSCLLHFNIWVERQ